MKLMWPGLILLLTIFTALGDSALKTAGKHKNNTDIPMLLLGLVIYVCTGLIWFFIYKNIKFSSAGAIYGVTTVIVFTMIGVFHFRESVSLIEYIGIASAVFSIVVLSKFA